MAQGAAPLFLNTPAMTPRLNVGSVKGWCPCYSDMLELWISACSAQYLYNVLAMMIFHQVCGHEMNSFSELALQDGFALFGGI